MDTNHARKAHTRGLVASQGVFHIINNHNKGKEHIIIRDDLVFTKKEATLLVYPYYNAMVVTLHISNNKIYRILGA